MQQKKERKSVPRGGLEIQEPSEPDWQVLCNSDSGKFKIWFYQTEDQQYSLVQRFNSELKKPNWFFKFFNKYKKIIGI